MIPLDLLIALSPSVLLACLWLVERIDASRNVLTITLLARTVSVFRK
jgi:hypothetical protein